MYICIYKYTYIFVYIYIYSLKVLEMWITSICKIYGGSQATSTVEYARICTKGLLLLFSLSDEYKLSHAPIVIVLWLGTATGSHLSLDKIGLEPNTTCTKIPDCTSSHMTVQKCCRIRIILTPPSRRLRLLITQRLFEL